MILKDDLSFSCGWQDFACSGCSGCTTFTTATGMLEDQSGTATNYADNATCRWIIAPTAATFVTVKFYQFDITDIPDSLTLYQCYDVNCSRGVEFITRFSGFNYPPTPVTSYTGVMMVLFMSDHINGFEGFSLAWTSDAGIPPTPPPTPSPSPSVSHPL